MFNLIISDWISLFAIIVCGALVIKATHLRFATGKDTRGMCICAFLLHLGLMMIAIPLISADHNNKIVGISMIMLLLGEPFMLMVIKSSFEPT